MPLSSATVISLLGTFQPMTRKKWSCIYLKWTALKVYHFLPSDVLSEFWAFKRSKQWQRLSGQVPETVKVSRVASKEKIRWIFLLPWSSSFTDSLPLGSQCEHFQVVDAIIDRRVDQKHWKAIIQRPNLGEYMIQTLSKAQQTQGIETLNFCLVKGERYIATAFNKDNLPIK